MTESSALERSPTNPGVNILTGPISPRMSLHDLHDSIIRESLESYLVVCFEDVMDVINSLIFLAYVTVSQHCFDIHDRPQSIIEAHCPESSHGALIPDFG